MAKTGVFWLVGNECKPGVDEKEFNRWYNEVHVPMAIEDGLVKSVYRCKLSDNVYHEVETTHIAPKYITIYEFETEDDLKRWLKSPGHVKGGIEKLEKWGEDGGYEVFWTSHYNVMQAWEDVKE